MRPPSPEHGEDEAAWLPRARAASERGPFGLHTHWTSPEHARPTGGRPAATVRAQVEWLRGRGVNPRFFCGGGWYTDDDVRATVTELGLVDCTATTFPLRYAAEARVVDGPSAALLPATHSLGMLFRSRSLPDYVHVYFHDTDLRDRRRALALEVALHALARLRPVADLDELSVALGR